MHEFTIENDKIVYEKIVKNTIIKLVLTSSLFITVHQFLLFRNEEKLVARVTTIGFRMIPFSLVVLVVCAQMRSESGITPYSPQYCSTA